MSNAMQGSFWGAANRYAEQDKFKRKLGGEFLARLDFVIDWEMFRTLLETIDQKERKSTAGRKPTDRVLMFKMLLLSHLYGLSDEALEYAVMDRLSFMRFLGLDLEGDIPDARTVWLFREQLREHELTEKLFAKFDEALRSMGAKLQTGQMVDASFVHAPVQRNSREENERIKAGETPEEWSDQKLAQKDVDARWTKKNGVSYYGYKDHVNVSKESKLITGYSVTDASVHDSQEIEGLLKQPEEEDKQVFADSAYRSKDRETTLKAKGYESQICEKGARNHPLTDAQKESNKEKSKTRARVEHVFGAMRNEMGGLFVRTIGLARAKVQVGLKNLAYNIRRVETLIRTCFYPFVRVVAPKNCQMA